jgi:N-methylhydantoinase A
VNFCVRVSLPVKLLALPRSSARGRTQDAVKGERAAYSEFARDFVPFTVYDRYRLAPGAQFQGPAIVEERESTVLVGENARITVDDYGFLWIELPQEAMHGR